MTGTSFVKMARSVLLIIRLDSGSPGPSVVRGCTHCNCYLHTARAFCAARVAINHPNDSGQGKAAADRDSLDVVAMAARKPHFGRWKLGLSVIFFKLLTGAGTVCRKDFLVRVIFQEFYASIAEADVDTTGMSAAER